MSKAEITLKDFDFPAMDAMTPMTGEEVKALRELVGVSQPVLAKLLRCSVANVRRWERGLGDVDGTALVLALLLKKNGLQSYMALIGDTVES